MLTGISKLKLSLVKSRYIIGERDTSVAVGDFNDRSWQLQYQKVSTMSVVHNIVALIQYFFLEPPRGIGSTPISWNEKHI